MFPSTMAPKIANLVPQCEMNHQKPSILLIFSTLSLEGCGAHPMRPKWNLKGKSQMFTPNEYTHNFKSNLICIFLSVRAKLKKNKNTLPSDTMYPVVIFWPKFRYSSKNDYILNDDKKFADIWRCNHNCTFFLVWKTHL